MTTREDPQASVARIVARFARAAPPFARDADVYRDLGIASVEALSLLLALEGELSISIDDQRFIRSRTVGDLAHLVEEAS
jgi:acyl carrier protein